VSQNHYQTLGLSPKVKDEEIQPAYRKLVAEVYPGVNRGEEAATTRMKEINRAYEVLRDPKKRADYDLTLTPGGAARPKSASKGADQSQNASAASGPSASMFGDAFNAMRDQARANIGAGNSAAGTAQPGSGPSVDIWLTPREAVDGTVKSIRVDGKLIRLNIRIKR